MGSVDDTPEDISAEVFERLFSQDILSVASSEMGLSAEDLVKRAEAPFLALPYLEDEEIDQGLVYVNPTETGFLDYVLESNPALLHVLEESSKRLQSSMIGDIRDLLYGRPAARRETRPTASLPKKRGRGRPKGSFKHYQTKDDFRKAFEGALAFIARNSPDGKPATLQEIAAVLQVNRHVLKRYMDAYDIST